MVLIVRPSILNEKQVLYSVSHGTGSRKPNISEHSLLVNA